MEKATLIVDEAKAHLRLQSDVVILEQPDQRVQRIGIGALKQIVLCEDVWLSSWFLNKMLAAGVSLVILPKRARDGARHLLPQPEGALALRIAQYGRFLDSGQRLAIAQAIVIAKIEAQEECLLNHGLAVPLERFVHSARQSRDIATLMGVEGAATARYFKAWGGLLDASWGFQGRNRRPPRDPVNSLMSLSYTMAGHALGRLAARAGFETTLGFLHAPASGRTSLALDLIEPLRPWVDEFVLTLCSGETLKIDDFNQDEVNGCRLSKAGSRVFFHRWFSQAETWFEQQGRLKLEQLRAALGVTELVA
ncbi:CRISPR-associated endonuclease Cas1 [Lamprobacter modestohalophilus]|uniref:CRISPR-associated endonuclease Cas1 n=1 Tax=Lamprobacter modestohalophilus TaxID=1064514 RepID=A0A9X1B564_9GAMM|nr:CRISPR-associated endonuclease Cas1 [Lamprobacter modestohalophilus]MBK1620158.1 CRISPR-associated endonuclease Cas1 [Lamprobacter modestohalophilus]